jgi:aminopeptidase Y
MRAHLEALQRIADEHGGTRAVGTTGYEASVDHVAAELRDAGYEVELRAVDVPAFEQEAPTILELTEPSERSWVDGTDLRAMLFSASGDVRAPVTAAEGGCDPSDLAGFPRGDVALLDPGPCLRREQVLNAQGAGAAAVIVAYADTAPGRPLRPTLLYPDGIEVPALAVTPGVGDALRAEGAERPTVHIQVSAMSRWTQADSVLAETTTGDPDSVVMLGAHLDSVIDGPGINDDGSGVAMLLEIARWMSTREADATVRFAFWAGEEEGLYGSREYVDALPEAERGAIVAYLNLDMVGSPNSVPYVIADQPADPAAAETTATIRELFTSWFEAAGLSTEPIDLHGGADHGPFAQAGIPVGGMHSGSSEIKTAVQAEANGGDAGQPMDACYHQACDTSANVSDVVMERFAAAYVQVLTVLAEVDASA